MKWRDEGWEPAFRMSPSYDWRERDWSKGAAACAMHLSLFSPMQVVGITFMVMTGWMHRPLSRDLLVFGEPSEATKPWPRERKPGVDAGSFRGYPRAGAVGVHSALPFPGQNEYGLQECDLIPGGKCYQQFGYLVGDRVMDALVGRGSDGAYEEMLAIGEEMMAGG